MNGYINKKSLLAYLVESNYPWSDFNDAYEIVQNAPISDVLPLVYGRWIPIPENEITGFNPDFAGCNPIAGYVCSVCRKEAILDCNDEFVLSNYCPNCGAKLDLEER